MLADNAKHFLSLQKRTLLDKNLVFAIILLEWMFKSMG